MNDSQLSLSLPELAPPPRREQPTPPRPSVGPPKPLPTYCRAWYANTVSLQVGDRVRIGEADCTVVRELLTPTGGPYIVVVRIAGLDLEHGVPAKRFWKVYSYQRQP